MSDKKEDYKHTPSLSSSSSSSSSSSIQFPPLRSRPLEIVHVPPIQLTHSPPGSSSSSDSTFRSLEEEWKLKPIQHLRSLTKFATTTTTPSTSRSFSSHLSSTSWAKDDDQCEQQSCQVVSCVPDIQYWLSISFGVSGMQVPFHMGVVKALSRAGIRCNQVYAASGGVIAGIIFLLGLSETLDEEEFFDLIPCGRLAQNMSTCDWLSACCRGERNAGLQPGSDHTGSNVGMDLARDRCVHYLRRLLDRDCDSYKQLNGRLFVVLSQYDNPNTIFPTCKVIVSEWTSNEDVIECFKAASTIPTLTGPFEKGQYWRGYRFVDGGWFESNPIYNRNTVCVSLNPLTSKRGQPAAKEKCHGAEIEGCYGDYGSKSIVEIAFYRQIYKDGYQYANRYIQLRNEFILKNHLDFYNQNFQFVPTQDAKVKIN